jgi:hypothetical protein
MDPQRVEALKAYRDVGDVLVFVLDICSPTDTISENAGT